MNIEQFLSEKDYLIKIFPWLRWNHKNKTLNGRKNNIEISIYFDHIYELPQILFLIYSNENLQYGGTTTNKNFHLFFDRSFKYEVRSTNPQIRYLILQLT